ncbi:unnamed protein product, partial [Mesorhabditis belari]|uniref:Neurotransmitter-gated ion-channel ligand-binding domain-containing protein n=1 Tax=Mesorhabditis belari TaxID=2138241 RepID=A0AAF3JAW3_9BILA
MPKPIRGRTFTDIVPDYKKTVKIYANGTLRLMEKTYVDTVCSLMLNHFPFDRQVCPMKFMVYSYDFWEVSMTWQINDFQLKYSSTGNWEVTNITGGIQFFPETFSFDAVIFEVSLKRQPEFYFFVIIIPTFSLCILSTTGLFWTALTDRNQIDKQMLGFGSLVSLMVILDIVSGNLPKTSHFPLLGFYVLISVFILCISCFVLTAIPLKNEKKKKENQKEIDEKDKKELIDSKIRFWKRLLRWQDIRLSWRPELFGGINHIWVAYTSVWIPENTQSDTVTMNDIIPYYKKTVKIYANGTLQMMEKTYVETVCPLNLQKFPFDEQLCAMKFMVWSYDFYEVSMTYGINYFDYSLYSGSGNWKVTNVTGDLQHFTSPEYSFDEVFFYMCLKREPQFYVFVIIFPTFILSTLTVFGIFWTPSNKKNYVDKIILGQTSLISITLLLDIVAADLPQTKQFPLLGFYVLISTLILCLACFFVTLAPLKVEKKEDELKPLWLRIIKCWNFWFQITLQLLNFINFIFLLSFWK